MPEIKDPVVLDYLGEGEQRPEEVARAILVFGRNSATYKFALAKTLLEQDARSEFSYGDIGPRFLEHLVEHHKICPHQQKRGETKLTKAIDQYLAQEIVWNDLFKTAEESIYSYVFDAFQVIGGGPVERKHQLFEHKKQQKKIVLTDNMNFLQESDLWRKKLKEETEARWRVVEEAWRENLSPLLILDERDRTFFTTVNEHRVNLRSAVDTLMPYQFGKCFYCRIPINADSDWQDDDFPDVDHVIPLSMLVKTFPAASFNPNGVWNLALSCARCNRGSGGKFESIPSEAIYERLLSRNMYFTKEHKHAMRFSVLSSLGVSGHAEVKRAMKEVYQRFNFFPKWRPDG